MDRPLHLIGASTVGFTLLETLIASGIVAAAALGVAQLFALTTETTRRAAGQTTMTLFAMQKLEQVKTDGVVSAGLEYLDAGGAVVAEAQAVYVREWSTRALAHDSRLLVIEVQVGSDRLGTTRIAAVRRSGGP